MKYLVMECHLSYAVVMDGEGAFLTVANRNYQVGQRLRQVEPLQQSAPQQKKRRLPLAATMCVSLLLVVAVLLQSGVFRWRRMELYSYPAIYTYDEMLQRSALVVRGKVQRRTDVLVVDPTHDGDNSIFTQYYLTVTHVLRGDAAVGDTVAVRIQGGKTPFSELACGDAPDISAGDEVVAFLYRLNVVGGGTITRGDYYCVVGQGWYRLQEAGSDPLFVGENYGEPRSLYWSEMLEYIPAYTQKHPVDELLPRKEAQQRYAQRLKSGEYTQKEYEDAMAALDQYGRVVWRYIDWL